MIKNKFAKTSHLLHEATVQFNLMDHFGPEVDKNKSLHTTLTKEWIIDECKKNPELAKHVISTIKTKRI